MKIYAKLLVVALILALFSIGSAFAVEDTNSSDLTQVPHEQTVSFTEASLQNDETINLETSDVTDESENILSSGSDDTLKGTDFDKESLSENKDSQAAAAANSEDELSATITPQGVNFNNIRDAISLARDGDVIDLGGLTYNGINIAMNSDKRISIVNGILDLEFSRDQYDGFRFSNAIFSNVTFKNIYFARQGLGAVNGFINCILNNVTFQNISVNSGFSVMRDTELEGCKFINLTSRLNKNAGNDNADYENGAMLVSYTSKYNNCLFMNCRSNQHSGAICVAGAPGNVVDITNSDFINCHSGIGGAVYVHGTDTDSQHHSNIINCNFINCSATEWGGALGSSQDYLNVEKCNFINNSAKQGAAFMVGGITHELDGNNKQGHYNVMKNCYFFNNTGSEEGGAVHIMGNYNSAINCTFDDNFAINGRGAAIFVEGNHSSVIDSVFTNHDSEMGTVYVAGDYFNCTHSTFEANHGAHGGAGIYVEGDHTFVFNSTFRNNNASMHGGAIHTVGDYARILNSTFKENNAIPSSENQEYGLGGAIYIDGKDNEISFSTFKHNTARNGSAIYNRGQDLVLNDDTFESNQAWSYFLFTQANPPESYWDEDLLIYLNVTLVAGDNLINAIYNDRPVEEIYFHNVTYWMKPNDLYPTGRRTTTVDEEHPVDGVENSHNGAVLYQDAREDNQLINVNVTYGDGLVFEYSGKTNILGNVLIPLRKENLTDGQFHPGVYNVSASHPDDAEYTAIHNSTTFKILPHVDVSVTKTSNKDVYFVGENAIFIITVNGVGTNATNVTVRDILPPSFSYVSDNPSKGRYNSTSNEWYIGFLPHGATETLTLTIRTTQLGTYDNVVNVTCAERDWNLSNNVANKTIHVDLHYTKEANVTQTSAGEYIEYYLRIYNVGSSDYTETFRVRDVMPAGIRYAYEYVLEGADLVKYLGYPDEQVWDITNITAGTHAKITVKAQAVLDGVWNNTLQINDYPSVNSTVNVSSSADLHIIKDVIPNIVNKGDIVNWTMIVINHGPSIAFNVYVDDFLPEGLEIAGHAIPSDNTRFDRTTGRWTIGTLGVEDYVTIIIPTRVTVSAGNITNVASVNSTTPDPDLSNNQDNATIYFNPDVSIVKVVSTQNTCHGDVISWTITVTNNGPNTATGVYVIDKITAEGLRYVNSSITKGSGYNPVSGRWTVGDLKQGESANLTIFTEVTMYDGFITNNATVYASNDNNPDNNYAENFTQVRTEADVGIVKLVSNQTSRYGDEIFWTIIVTNHGPNTAENVVVIDFLPNTLIQTREPYRTKGSISHDGSNGKWIIGSLAKGENATLIVYTKVLATNQTVINVVNVTTSTHDPDLTNNEAENGTYVPPECDVQIVKSVSNHDPEKGDTVVWTIEVINVGPNVAENVVVREILPEGLEYISHERPTAGSFNGRNWTIGRLAVNSRQVLNITTRVAGTGNITNEVNVTTSTYDTNLNNNYDNETIHVRVIADLEIFKEVSNRNPKFGEIIYWTIKVHNRGPNNAKDVYVIDKLPSGLIYVTDSTEGESYNPISGRWTIGDLLNNATVSLVITTKVNITNASINNVAVVYSSTPDENETNNRANNTTYVDPIADLAIGKFVSNVHPAFGEEFTYYIFVTNLGPDTAVNAYVCDILPEGLIYISDDSNGKYNPTTGIWEIGNLTAEDGLNFRSLEIIVKVNVTQPDVIKNSANVTSETPDPDLTNNEDNVTIDVGHIADLKIIKLVSSNTSKIGDEITWTIRVYNFGPNTAIGAYVIDSLPEELIYLSHEVSMGRYNHETGIWEIGDIEYVNNETYVWLSIRTRVNVTNKNITNVAVVNSTTPDSNESNNEANNTTVADSFADLEIIKIVSNRTSRFGDVITWTVTVINHGPNTAYNVTVIDKLPAGLIYQGDDSEGKYDSTTGIWNIGELEKGRNSTIVITTLVNITNATINNVAVVNSTTPDSNESNNKANNTTYVEPLADLEIVKLVSDTAAKKGDTVIWTVIVTNKGPDTAKDVRVRDKLPDGLIYSGHTGGFYDSSQGIWLIGDLAKDANATLIITTVVGISNGTIINVAVVNSTTPDNNTDNNEANNTTVVGDNADLEVIKIVSNKNPHKGDTITWTITVTNHGPSDAKNVIVTDKLPAGLIFKGANGTYNPETGQWTVGDLANGKSISLVITTLVNITNRTITNIANVTSDTPDSNKTNNEGNNTTDVSPEADLEIIKIVSNRNPHKGDTITWTIIVINKGPDTAVNVKVTDKLPEGLIFNGANGDYNPVTGIWNAGNLAKGENRTLVIDTVVNVTNRTITNIANVTSGTYDPNGTNDEANNTTEVSPEADLEIIKLVSAKTVNIGDVITWTIIVTNKGPDTALNVDVVDELPKGLVYRDYSYTKGMFDYKKMLWHIKSLARGESATLTIDTLINASDVTLVNNVNVTNDVYDPNQTNNKANNNTTVVKEQSADLEIIKAVSNKNPRKGDTITWTITVINHGPGVARDVTVTDKLPKGLRFVSSDGNYNMNTGVWKVGNMNGGEIKSLVITTVVTLTNARITNVAVVNSSTPDDNPDNNRANNTTHVGAEADLKIVKTVSNPKPSKGDVITWTIVVVNLGPDTAYDVAVSENLPVGLKLLKVKGSKGSYSNGIWSVGTLKKGEIATLTITTEVLVSQGTIENIVVVTSSTYDPDKSNNKDKEITNPKDKIDIGGDEPDDGGDDVPDDGKNPVKPPAKRSTPTSTHKMHATGNPILIVLLALLAVFAATSRRKD